MASCFQDSVCFAVYARMIPHTYPTSENSATLPLSACQEHEVITDLVGLFLSPCCDIIFPLLEKRSISVLPIVTGLQCLHH